MFSTEKQRYVLAFFLVAAFVSALPFFIFKNIPEQNKDIITYMVGQLSGMAATAIGFYFVNKAGQDTLDAKKSDNTAKLADAVVAAANAGNGTQPVVDAARDVAGAAAARAAEIAGGGDHP